MIISNFSDVLTASSSEYVTYLEENMADNYRVETTRKRGRSPSKLVVRPFLLDPDENVKKTTKKIGSSKAISELQQKRYGPPSNGKYNSQPLL
jgi:hypothetical protein